MRLDQFVVRQRIAPVELEVGGLRRVDFADRIERRLFIGRFCVGLFGWRGAIAASHQERRQNEYAECAEYAAYDNSTFHGAHYTLGSSETELVNSAALLQK